MADEKKTPAKKADTKADSKKSKSAKDNTKSKKDSKKKKKNPFKTVGAFFKSVRSESKKVVWADAKDTLKNSLVVLVVVAIAGVAIYATDSLLALGMKGIKSAKENTTVSTTAEQTTASADADASTTAAAE